MEFTIKPAAFEDLQTCTAIDIAAIGSSYLPDAWHYFSTLKGELLCVYAGDEMVGIGRFSVLPDGSGWLETLRVHPQWQGKGVGKAIYREYHRLARTLGCPSMAMFTGVTNAASAGLARRSGLALTAQHRGCHLTDLSGGCAHGFRHVNWARAEELILPMADTYHNYMVFNRTFFRVNAANVRAFANEGKVFEDPADGSFIVCGARFQHQVTLHIAMMGGDYDRCLDFAVNYARAQGLTKVSCTFAAENAALEQVLTRRGFVFDPRDLITMEICF